MSRIDIRHDHTLSTEAARDAIEAMAAKLTDKFSLNTKWDGDALTFNGSGVNGQIELLAHQVRVVADLGFPVSMMKGMVEGEIQRVLQEKLA